MKRPLLVLALVCSCALLAQAPSSAPTTAREPAPVVTSAPAREWVLPIFSDREGFRVMTLRGSEVRQGTGGTIDVTNLNITVFTGDATEKVDTVVMSQAARYFPKENRASGTKAVRVLRDEIDVTGENWTYDHKTKNVSIEHNVRVIYRAPLDIRL